MAHLLADDPCADEPAWHLHAIHRTGPATSAPDAPSYLVEAANPATGEVRPVLSLAAYHQLAATSPVVPAV